MTYGYYWADTGARVYLFDSTRTSGAVLQLLEAKWAAESAEYRQLREYTRIKRRIARLDHGAMNAIIMGREEEADALADEHRALSDSLRTMDEALLHTDPRKAWDSLERLAYIPSSPLFADRSARVTETAGGTYAFRVAKPGAYYILIQPLNKQAGVATGCSIQHRYYLQKLVIRAGDKQDAGTAFKL